MSATITTTTTTITTTFNKEGSGFVGIPRNGNSPYGAESSDILPGRSQRGSGAPETLADVLDDMELPAWLKSAVRNMIGAGEGGGQLPSDASAAKTINGFQKEHGIRYLSDQQVRQMADTGYFTDKNGKSIQVPEEVQLAAQKMMANGGELFRKLESATNGEHDGVLSKGDYTNAVKDGTISANGGSSSSQQPRGISLEDFLNAIMNGNISSNRPSEYGTAKTINDFQKEHDIGLLSIGQLQQMAETGYCKGKDGKFIQVPEEVQDAARAMMANNCELFKKLECAKNGKHDGQLSIGDFNEAVKDGSIGKGSGGSGTYPANFVWQPEEGADGLPSRSDAAGTMRDFQQQQGIGKLGIDQVQQMAQTGYYKDVLGRSHQVPEEVQLAAQKMLANGSELFKQLESASNGEHDGRLSLGDYEEAIKDGSIQAGGGERSDRRYIMNPRDVSPAVYEQSSAAAATQTMRDFQGEHKIRFLEADQVNQMAATGYFTGKDGKTIQVPEEVQQAAQRMLANGSELFKELESATNGEHDGRLSMGDYRNAGEDRTFQV
jgi:hypothetical protein